MFKTGSALFLYAESSVHLGSGQSFAAIDLAIQRERFTGLPMGAASGLKGAARDWFERTHAKNDQQVLAAFGPDTDNASAHAGALVFTDLRLLLFPIRSLKGIFAWATSPFVLERFKRDLAVVGQSVDLHGIQADKRKAVVATDSVLTEGDRVVLEEFALTRHPNPKLAEVGRWLAEHALPQGDEYAHWREMLPKKLVLLHDDDFRDFTQHATEVVARIKLNDKKTTTGDGGNLFYQENLSAESLLYALVLAQDDLSGTLANGAASDLLGFARQLDGQRLQIGGDESTGRGLTSARFLS